MSYFIHHNLAYYAPRVSLAAGITDKVTVYLDDIANGSNLDLEWGELFVRVVFYSNTWKAMLTAPELLGVLAAFHNQQPAPDQLCKALLAVGFEDQTPTNNPV